LIRIIALCAFFLIAAAGPLAAADSARVRVGAHEPPGKDPFGRIVFEWTAPVAYKAAVESGRLVIHFAQPFAGRLDMVTRYLGDYVSDARIEEGGRTVVFPLKADFDLKTYADGPIIVLDLTRTGRSARAAVSPVSSPAPAPAPATPKPAASAPPAAHAPVLGVRVGDHPGFSRLVFDWTRNVEYAVARDGDRVTIRFDHPAKLDYAALRAHLPQSIRAAEPASVDKGVGMTLTLADNARLRHFRSGTYVVVDVLDPPGGAAKAAPTASAKAKPVAPVKAAPPVEAKSVAAAAAPENLLARPSVAPKPDNENDDKPAPSLDEVLARIPGLSPKPAHKPEKPAKSAPAAPATAPSAAPKPVHAARPNAETSTLRLVVKPLGTVNDLKGLRFSWPQEVGAAIYERSGFLWLIFDRRAVVDVVGAWPRTAVKPQAVPNVTSADVTVLRWPVPHGMHPGLRRDGKDWLIELGTSESPPSADVKPEPHVAIASGARILLRGSSFGAVRAWRDPEVGDRLWVVPTAEHSLGSAADRRLAEVEFIATLQGLVVKPFSDGVVVRNVPEGIEVTMPGGLNLSANGGVVAHSSGRTPIPALATRSDKLFDFAAWRTPKDRNFFDRKNELLRAVIEAPPPSRNAARFALAQFFFAHGYAADTLGILQVIEEDDKNAEKDPLFRALRGASHYLAGDYTAAGADLFNGALDTEREIALWRGALLASQHDWFAASRYFSQGDRVLHEYPMDLRLRFGLLAAESALMIDDVGLAKFQLDGLARLKPARIWRDQIDYLKGRVLAKMNDVDGAVSAWERAMAGVDRPSKVKARYARAEALLAAGRMTPKEAIDEIEKLRYAWRGDDTEVKVLTKLGDLYLDTAEYRDGLTTLRQVVTYFPKAAEAQGVGDKMRAAFATLYLKGAADKMPPLAALSLYDDFHDLAPSGEAGDAVASKLVDRLVDVELLDRAADVLKHQIDTRLKGAALAEAMNRLGLIYLLARKPEEALAVLNRRVPEATPTAMNQRRQMLARTLGELARYDEALALLENDSSRDADRLRAEIGWRTQDWPVAAAAFEQLVPPPDKPMTDAGRQTVLRLAIAQSLSHDAAGLKALRKSYSAAMAKSAFKESFDLVTAPNPGPNLDLRTITRQVAEVDEFRAFIASYRDKLLTRKERPTKPAAAVTPKGSQQAAASN
jgi:hypothetical protein